MSPTPTEQLRRADAMFAGRLARLGESDWQRITPCTDWSVRQVVGHVVAGSAMAAALVRGASRNEAIAILGVDELGDDPTADYRRVLDDQLAAFEAVESLDATCEHPAGDMTAHQLLDLRVGDLVIHTWDIAVAAGLDTELDADLVEAVWAALAPMAPIIGHLGVFGDGPSGTVPADAPAQARLLDLTGRRP